MIIGILLTRELIYFSASLAMLAYVYSQVITAPGQLLNGVYKFLDQKVFTKKWMQKWLFKPLMACEKCVSGQWALWLYLYFYFYEYNFIQHAFFIGLTIFIATVINEIFLIIEKIKE